VDPLMSDGSQRKLFELLDARHPAELRLAALTVLEHLGSLAGNQGEVLLRALEDADPQFRLRAIRAVGRLGIENALPVLLARIRLGGPESEAAAAAAAQLGPRAARALEGLMTEVPPGLRTRIAGALASGDNRTAETAAVAALADTDPNVVMAAARSIMARVPTLDRGHRRRLADLAMSRLTARGQAALSSATEEALLRLLAAVEDTRALKVLWQRAAAGGSPSVRAAALESLGRLPIRFDRAAIQVLMGCARDADFQVAAPALILLSKSKTTAAALADWIALLQAPDVATRRFALERIGNLDRLDVARAVMPLLDDSDPELRSQASTCLKQTASGNRLLAEAILNAESPERAWFLAKVYAQKGEWPKTALGKKILERAFKYLEAADRRAEALLLVFREADADKLRDLLERRALALRKEKTYVAANAYFRMLMRDPASPQALRLESALCALKVSKRDSEVEARLADPAIQQLGALIRRGTEDLADLVRSAGWLMADDLFYVGFHFIESKGTEREFGAQVLEHMLKRFPRNSLSRFAKQKLKAQGFKVGRA
jgi:HEAT repeat protein